MAGIGFTLRNMLKRDTYWSQLQAYMCASVITSGPWIVTALALGVVGNISQSHSPRYLVFPAIITTAFPAALVGVGAIQMVVSRYLADHLYRGESATFVPTFFSLLLPLLVINGSFAAAFLIPGDLPDTIKVLALSFFALSSCIFLALIFLSAARDFVGIVGAFALGALLAVLGAMAGDHWAGLIGEMAGFTLGFSLIFFVLLYRMFAEFGYAYAFDSRVFPYFLRYWPLAVVGVAYDLANWIDKVLFWHSPLGETIAGMPSAPLYDNAMFLAYLSVIPGLGLFTLAVETNFYDQFRAFYAAIERKESLVAIRAAKGRIIVALRDNLGLLIKLQSAVTLPVLLFAPELLALLHRSPESVYIFRYGVAGAFAQTLHMICMIFLLYFDRRQAAMAVALAFLASNLAFSLLSIHWGFAYYGWGYLAANLTTLAIAYGLFQHAIDQLEFHTFMEQPL